MSKPKAPPAPDFVGAANAQGAANKEASLQGGILSNPNVTNPYGSRNVTWSQGTGDLAGYWMPSVSETLSPAGQSQFDQETAIKNTLMAFANAGLGRVASEMQLTPSQIAENLHQSGFDLRGAPTGREINFNAPAGGAGVQGSINTGGLPGMPGSVSPSTDQMVTGVNQGPIQGRLGQTNLGIPGDVDRSTVPGFRPSDIAGLPGVMDPSEATRKQIASSILARMEPGLAQAEDASRSDLVARGFREGTKGYQDTFDAHGRNRNDAAIAADIAGGQEMDRIFREQLAKRNQFANEQFTAEQNATSARMGESAAQLGRANYRLGAQGQEFGQELAGGQFANQAQAQDFSQRMQNATMQNLVGSQGFNQRLQAAQFDAGARNQLLNELMATGQFTNAAQAQSFIQQLQSMQGYNTAQGQEFQQGMQGNTFDNQARQQAIQEALLARNLPLNELNALRMGNQVNVPQFSNWQGSNVAPAPIYAANVAQGDYATDLYNAQMGNYNSGLSGIFGLGSSWLRGGMPGIG